MVLKIFFNKFVLVNTLKPSRSKSNLTTVLTPAQVVSKSNTKPEVMHYQDKRSNY